MGEVTQLDTLIGQEFGRAGRQAIDDVAGGDVDLVASHGQTLYHWVVGARAHGSLQLGNAAWIAERTKRPVISDFRVADIAAGGQGAPLVSVLDALWLGRDPQSPDGAPAAVLGSLTPPTPLVWPAFTGPIRRLVLANTPFGLAPMPKGTHR